MRLRRLDLLRYGHFTGRTLDFGPAGDGPDLHLVYGGNEAGKSTMLNAWLDLLFGIPGQSAHGFLHPYATMRIGAAIETGGQVIEVARIKGTRGTLLGAGDAPLSEDALRVPLGGLDRDAMRAMYTLDDDTIERGGDSILASEGEVGQMLFASGAGLAGFAPGLEALRKAADQFHRPGARSGGLADLTRALAALDAERAQIDTDALTYARLSRAVAAAEADWTAAQAAQAATAAALRGVRRNLSALPALRALRSVEARLAVLPDLPPPPQGWADDLARLDRDRAEAAGKAQVLAEQVRGLQAGLAACVADPAMLSLRDRVAAAAALKGAHDEGVKDLPARQDEIGGERGAVAAALARLGRDAAAPHPSDAALSGLRVLIEGRSGLDASLATARDERTGAVLAADQAARDLSAAGDEGGDTAALAVLLRDLRASAPQAVLARAVQVAEEAQAVWQSRALALRPWQGTAQALAALDLPAPSLVAAWKAALTRAAEGLATAQADAARWHDELAQSSAVPQATDGTAAALAARQAREAAWAAHRAALDAASADAFEAAMRADDLQTAALALALADARAGELAVAARHAARQRHETALAAQQAARDAAAAVRAEMAAALAVCGLPDMTPEALDDWMRRRLAALEAGDTAAQADRARTRAEADVAAARQALLATMGGGDAHLPVLLARADALCAASDARGDLRRTSARLRADLVRRQAALDASEAADRDWHVRWRAALAAAGLPEGRSLSAARDDIATLDGLRVARDRWSALADRIAKMQANVAAFVQAVADIADALGLPPGPTAPQWQALTDRLAAAEAASQRIADLSAQVAGALRGAQAQADRLASIDRRLADMAAAVGASDADDLRRRLQAAQDRMTALAEAGQWSDTLRDTMQVPDTATARAALDGADEDALIAQEALLAEQDRLQAGAAQRAFATLSEAQRQIDAIGGDAAAARMATARATLLQQIGEAARAHLDQRLGLIAVDHALRRYRDHHRSAMLQGAAQAFHRISRGAYADLTTQPDGPREVLVAVRAGGGSKRAAQMSKGTRFQLYLALRIAAHRERAGHGPVPPFVADDIMETFDDARAAQAFGLLADMAQRGQVIYLTHHRHLCDIAARECPGVRLHRLD